MSRSALAVVVAILVATGFLWRPWEGTRGGVEGPVVAGPPTGAPAGAIPTERVADAGPRRDPASGSAEARPRSLRGTQVDGALLVDGSGHLLVSPDARRFFDYFLSASGEEPPATLRARVVAAIEAQLGPPAAGEAIALLDRYLRYRERARDLVGTAVAADLTARARAVSDLRREVIGEADAAALFADEDAQLRIALAERAIVSDPNLTDEERARRLAMLADEAPDDVREARAAAMLAATLRREEAALRQQGGSADEVRALRERMVGAAAADRLAALDERRADWQDRLDAYRAERERIEADPNLDETARRAGVERLRAERFSKQEQVRVRALDRGAARQAPAGVTPAGPPRLDRPLAPGPASP